MELAFSFGGSETAADADFIRAWIDHLLLGRPVLSFTFICSCESFYIHSLSYIRIYKYVQERVGWGLIFPPAPESPFDVGRLLGVRATCLLVAWVVVVLQTFQSALGF